MAQTKKMIRARFLKVGTRVFLPADPDQGLEEVRGVVHSVWEDGFYVVFMDDDICEVPAAADELVEVID